MFRDSPDISPGPVTSQAAGRGTPRAGREWLGEREGPSAVTSPSLQGFQVAYVVFRKPKGVSAALALKGPLLVSTESHPVKSGIHSQCCREAGWGGYLLPGPWVSGWGPRGGSIAVFTCPESSVWEA